MVLEIAQKIVDNLDRHLISFLQDNPFFAELSRHIQKVPTKDLPTAGVTFNDKGRGLGLVRELWRYLSAGDGLLAMVAAPIRAFVRSREGLAADARHSCSARKARNWRFVSSYFPQRKSLVSVTW